jgi:hypothetical protein
VELATDLRRGCAITSKLGELYGFDSAGQGAAARGKEPLRGALSGRGAARTNARSAWPQPASMQPDSLIRCIVTSVSGRGG